MHFCECKGIIDAMNNSNSNNNRRNAEHIISSVESGSIAQEMELEPGDILLSVNGQEIEDIFDYRYLIHDELITVLVRKPSGEEWELEIEKDYDEDLGIDFENPLMDRYRSCRNKCIFCFIDQLPRGMRPTLYFKDDDSRLSFLQGNYLTLTNMTDHDIDRIIRYHLEPINISFQTMNPQLRCRMLGNRFAGDVFDKVLRLAQAGIEMNGQIVLCAGINDGDELEYSLQQLEQYMPALRSVSVVPAGLTKYRDGLYPLRAFDREEALTVLGQIHRWQAHYLSRWGTHLVHGGDEWYLLAGLPVPEEENYDGYLQLENGVGMIRLLLEETRAALEGLKGDGRRVRQSIATGLLASPHLQQILSSAGKLFPNVDIRVYPIINRFFGEQITVAGLLTGQDLYSQLKGKDLGERLLLTRAMLRSGEEVFLDDMTVQELSEALQIPIRIVESDGTDFINACLGEDIVPARQQSGRE